MQKLLVRAGIIAAVLVLATAAPLRAEDQSAAPAPAATTAEPQKYENLLQVLLQSSTTVLGETITYPTGPAKITTAIVTIPPGGETGWHKHGVPLVAYILDGALTVDYGDHGTKVYEAGNAVVEAIGIAHNGMNKGTVPMRLLAVYMGAEGLPNTEAVPH